MGIDLKAEGVKRCDYEQQPDEIKRGDIASADGEFIEISEDAYKQNNVYRPWRAGSAGERKAG